MERILGCQASSQGPMSPDCREVGLPLSYRTGRNVLSNSKEHEARISFGGRGGGGGGHSPTLTRISTPPLPEL